MSKFNLERFLAETQAARKPCTIYYSTGLEQLAETYRERFADRVEFKPGLVTASFETQQLDQQRANDTVAEVVDALEPKATETGGAAVFLLDGKSLVEGDPKAVDTLLALTKTAIKDNTDVVAAFLPHPDTAEPDLSSQGQVARIDQFLEDRPNVTVLHGEAALEAWLASL